MDETRKVITTSVRTLNIAFAMFWYMGGIILAVKGGILLLEAETLRPGGVWFWPALAAGLSAGWLKVKYIFSRSCRKNLARISSLSKPTIWRVLRPEFALFLLAMILLGATLSRMAHGNYHFLIGMTILDFSLATALLGSSYVFWEQRVLAHK